MIKKLIFGLSILALASAMPVVAQVTIGSGQKANPGSLLDLKQKADGTSKLGLGMPRVKLDNVTKLKMGTNEILDTDNGGDQYKKHTGLWVYNISGYPIPKCAPIPDGLYVWDGAKWNRIGTPESVDPATLTLSGSDINFPSGLDLRALPTIPETFTATWTPTGNPVAYTNTPHTAWGGISFNGANTPPANGNLTTSPTAFSLLPNAMTAAEITANPFFTKQNTLTFKVANECGAEITEIRVVNQTNKALTVSTPYKEYIANAPNTTNTLTTNTNWKLASIMPADATNAISNVRIGSPAAALATDTTQTGYEQNNNAGKAATLTYDIAVGASKARYSILTFADTENPKRFSDVTITVLQCMNVGVSPSIEQWALTAGFTQPQINNVKSTGTDSPILATGIQLHRDQSNNLFLSSNFGTNPLASDQRWMIHNLTATDFDRRLPRTGSDATVLQNFGTSPSGVSNYLTPQWAYPKAPGAITVGEAASTQFTNNPRLGRLYNWAAATNSRGNTTTGQQSITDGEPATHATIQGICPNGWHLPSDVEWTTLEQEINTRTTAYSSQAANANGTITVGGIGYRGTLHGKAMKEICEPTDVAKTHQGTSNGITSTARPGFDLLLAGFANNGSAGNFGTYGYLWSASGNGTVHAWGRVVGSGFSQVDRGNAIRGLMLSVRCKK